jgi:FkbM family methyltransferase
VKAPFETAQPARRRPPWDHRLLARWYRAREHPGRLRIIGWLKRLRRIGALQVEVAPGVIMELDEHDYIQREIIFQGSYEPQTITLFERLLGHACSFLDIGAHHGQYALRAAHAVRDRGRVVAIEPNPKNARALLRNAALSGLDNLDVCTIALSDTPGLLRLVQPLKDNSGHSRLSSSAIDTPGTCVHVAVRPFHDLLPLLPTGMCDLVKIDVEGFEGRVLTSLFAATPHRPRHIIAEYCPQYFDYGMRLADFLAAHDYRVRDVTGRPWREAQPLVEDNLWAELRSQPATSLSA